jgi:O-antigen/teichoic acid export membrane protein
VVTAQALITSSGIISGTPVALLRLTERLSLVAGWRIGAQVVSAVAIIAAVATTGTVGGYYAGAAIAALVQVPAAAVVSAVVWRRIGVPLLMRGNFSIALTRYLGELRFLVHGGVMGYAKMLHRGADVLLVAWVTPDAATGVYRLARQLSDGLYVVFDAVSQVYGPRLLSLLADGRASEFRRIARRAVMSALLATALVELAVLLGTPVLQDVVLTGQYEGLAAPLALLVLPFAIVLGVHLWLWTILVHLGRLDVLVVPAVVSAIAQTAFIVFAVPRLGDGPAWAALAYVMYYFTAYGAALAWAVRWQREYVPTWRPKVGA